MSNLITISIDVCLIDKTKLRPGKKKNRQDKIPQYLDLVLIPTKPTQYNDMRDKQTHMVCQSVTKEERESGVRGEILGNAIEMVGNRDRRPPATENNSAETAEPQSSDDDEVPY